MKLEKLIQISSGADEWGPNILAASKDLQPQYQEQFVRYLANPSGAKGNFTMKASTPKELENLQESNPNINFQQKQKFINAESKILTYLNISFSDCFLFWCFFFTRKMFLRVEQFNCISSKK